MARPEDLIALEDSWVGLAEDPPGSNNTWIGDAFGYPRVAWCAETQSVATATVFGRRIFWSAAVSEWIAAAQAGTNGLAWLPADADVEAGMLATFDFGRTRGNPANFHISMIRDPGTQAKFQTDGGNEGDAMRQQWRDRTYVQGFIVLPFDTPTPPEVHTMRPAPAPVRINGQTFTYVVGTDGQCWEIGPSGQRPLGGQFSGGIGATVDPDTKLVTLAGVGLGPDFTVWELDQQPGGVWTGAWRNIGGAVHAP